MNIQEAVYLIDQLDEKKCRGIELAAIVLCKAYQDNERILEINTWAAPVLEELNKEVLDAIR